MQATFGSLVRAIGPGITSFDRYQNMLCQQSLANCIPITYGFQYEPSESRFLYVLRCTMPHAAHGRTNAENGKGNIKLLFGSDETMERELFLEINTLLPKQEGEPVLAQSITTIKAPEIYLKRVMEPTDSYSVTRLTHNISAFQQADHLLQLCLEKNRFSDKYKEYLEHIGNT